jgi:hypothetical protein
MSHSLGDRDRVTAIHKEECCMSLPKVMKPDIAETYVPEERQEVSLCEVAVVEGLAFDTEKHRLCCAKSVPARRLVITKNSYVLAFHKDVSDARGSLALPNENSGTIKVNIRPRQCSEFVESHTSDKGGVD